MRKKCWCAHLDWVPTLQRKWSKTTLWVSVGSSLSSAVSGLSCFLLDYKAYFVCSQEWRQAVEVYREVLHLEQEHKGRLKIDSLQVSERKQLVTLCYLFIFTFRYPPLFCIWRDSFQASITWRMSSMRLWVVVSLFMVTKLSFPTPNPSKPNLLKPVLIWARCPTNVGLITRAQFSNTLLLIFSHIIEVGLYHELQICIKQSTEWK